MAIILIMKRRQSYRKVKRYIKGLLQKELDRNKRKSFIYRPDFGKMLREMDCVNDYIKASKHIKDIPNHLYKYRACNEDNFSALEKRSIWLSRAKGFRDLYDCRLPLSISSLPDAKINKLMKWFLFSEYIYGYKEENLSRFEYAFTPAEVRSIMFSKCYTDELFMNVDEVKKYISNHYSRDDYRKNEIKFMYFDEIVSRYGRGEKLREWFRNDGERDCKNIIARHREEHCVCSLTETNDNAKMWEEYSDNYTGFCIGYDFSQGINRNLIQERDCLLALQSLFPVFYSKCRHQVDAYDYLLQEYQEVFYEDQHDYWGVDYGSKSFMENLFKSKYYESEQEWRVVLVGDEPGLIYFPFITSIYLGKDIKPEHKQRLLTIAKSINISVYQQTAGIYGYTYTCIQSVESSKLL